MIFIVWNWEKTLCLSDMLDGYFSNSAVFYKEPCQEKNINSYQYLILPLLYFAWNIFLFNTVLTDDIFLKLF